ncbi:MAG TPA: preprotein translocase subunit YajC [Magnetospirillaceae bacterium]|nr:preprotein translocase subunit YajC [Magnetospirillaceae bacterium]
MNTLFASLPVLQQAQGNATGNMMSTIVMFGLIFVIFYFLIIRPQNKKQKAVQQMLAGVQKGDRIVTIGGVHGVVHAVKEGGTVIVKVDETCKLEFSKSAIASVLNRDSAKELSEKAGAEKGETASK